MATVSMRVNTDGLTQLAERLRLVASELKPRVTETILTNAKRTAVVAAANAAKHSKKVPPTVKALPFGEGAVVQAGDASVPLAALMERGSTFKPNPTSWRHPLFGDKEHWYGEKTHPYLAPAVLATRAENALRLVAAVTDLAAETVGPELPA